MGCPDCRTWASCAVRRRCTAEVACPSAACARGGGRARQRAGGRSWRRWRRSTSVCARGKQAIERCGAGAGAGAGAGIGAGADAGADAGAGAKHRGGGGDMTSTLPSPNFCDICVRRAESARKPATGAAAHPTRKGPAGGRAGGRMRSAATDGRGEADQLRRERLRRQRLRRQLRLRLRLRGGGVHHAERHPVRVGRLRGARLDPSPVRQLLR